MYGQVKLRGFRIELGEVEAALLGLPGVQQAVALVLRDLTGSQRLAAYVTPASIDAAASVTELKGRLPAHMVPSVIVPLERMPLLPNEKIDRNALPQPDWATAASEEYVAPASALEARLQAIWHDVLGQEPISTQSDFFSVGGNSLQARPALPLLLYEPLRIVRVHRQLLSGRGACCLVLMLLMLAVPQVGTMMAKVRQVTGCDVPTALAYSKTTIAGLAVAIEELAPTEAPAAVIIPSAHFSAAALAAGVPCAPNQQRLLRHGNLRRQQPRNACRRCGAPARRPRPCRAGGRTLGSRQAPRRAAHALLWS